MTPLSSADLARIDAYRGGAGELHELLAALPPLAARREWAADIVAARGTRMRLVYVAEPHPDGIVVSWAASAAGSDRVVVCTRPALVTARGMDRPDTITDAEWRETRTAAGIVIRALLLGIGDAP